MMNKFLKPVQLTLALVMMASVNSCYKPELEAEVPNCIKRKIRKIQRQEVRNPPVRVSEWNVDGKKYFHITSGCCDQYNYLYNHECEVVCAPDGGHSGAGDGNCPEFEGEVQWTLVWEDERN